MSASRKSPAAGFFRENRSPSDSETGYRFSREDVSGLSLFARPSKRRLLQQGTMIYMENAGKVRMEPALGFLQKVLSARIPSALNIVCQRDKNASLQTVICRNRGRGDTLQLEVDTECVFKNSLTERLFSAGSVKMIFRMHDQKVGGKWGYEFNSIQTDSPLIAAFFHHDEDRLQAVLRDLHQQLTMPETGFRRIG